ncbi:MAG: hypothetical protein KF773_40275 [Deltaproteobacteria bacterium]|nr:hypothetical protein [Deltaproteobacteria bacterium]MCW5804372.1 hypothetical protein [Deltaproteobacteria bacterium]
MQQLARLKFTSFNLKVPQNWQAPSGDPDAKHYGDAFQASEKTTAPGMPPLFQPASMNKYHTDTQKMHIDKIGKFIDGICSAICSAWSQWQSLATMSGIVVNAVTAMGGMLVGPPLQPLILASAPKESPMLMKYSNAIATVISTGWQTFTATVKVMGMPWYPAFAAFPGPMAPPTPNIPCPFAALTQVPMSISCNALKGLKTTQLGDPMAPFHQELFEAIADAFEKCYNIWKASTMVTNVLGTGPIPTFAPPFVPIGPVVGGTAMMAPGGLV